MKHVLVMHVHNLSANFLAAQQPNDPIAVNYDSADIYKNPDSNWAATVARR